MPNYYTWSRSRLLQVYSSQAAADAAAAAGSIPVGQPVAVNGGDLVGMVVAGPSIQWNAAPSNTYTSVAGGYAAVLAHARANASDGDVYLDADSGVFFGFYKPAGAQGVLVPTDLSVTYASNASGGAFASSSVDTEAAIVARGYQTVDGAGTVTGGGGAPWHINGDAYLQFVPTTIQAKYLILAAVSDIVGATGTFTQLYAILGDGGVTAGARYRLGLTAGAPGTCELNSGGAPIANARGALSLSGTAWIAVFLDDTAGDSLCKTTDLDQGPEVGLVCEASDLITSTSKLFRLGCSAGHQMKVHEFHVLEVA